MSYKVLISGSSGFIGKELVSYLKNLHYEPIRLVRSKDRLNSHSIYWNPDCEEINLKDFEGFHAVIHLAGESLLGYWTLNKKKKIFLSRARDTWLLSHLMTRLLSPPKIFLTTSAIGYYGDRADELLTESSASGSGFLADVCIEWEKATEILSYLPTRIIHTRFGMVLSPKGGMLKALLPFFRWGFANSWGKGDQWMSWISLQDLISSLGFILNQPDLSGSVNIVSPSPIQNRDFIIQIAKQVKRFPFFSIIRCPISSWIIKILAGEMGRELLLSSQRVLPRRLLESGFQFQDTTLESVIRL